MRVLTCAALVLLVLTGCSRRTSSPTGANAAIVPNTKAMEQYQSLTAPPPNPIYQGRTAEQWKQQLRHPAQMTRHQAADALGKMDEAGFPHLLEGMRTGSSDVRRTCLNAVYRPILVKHEQEVLGLLVSFLKDRDPLLREAALARLAWFEKRGGPAIPHIHRVALNDSDPQVRDAAKTALYQISVAMSPTPLRHDDVNKKFGP